MECVKQPHEMTADNKITFTNDGFNMDMKDVDGRQGSHADEQQKAQHMEGKYLGPCK